VGLALDAGDVAPAAQFEQVQLGAHLQHLRHRVGRKRVGLAVARVTAARIPACTATAGRLHLGQGEQGQGGRIQGARAGQRFSVVAGELGVGEVQITTHQGHQREAGVGAGSDADDLVRIESHAQPVVGIALVPVGDALLQHQATVDLAVGWRKVVGVEGLDPVECCQVLPGLLQLQRQRQRHEVKDFLQVSRRPLRSVGITEQLPDELAAFGQLAVTQLLGDDQGAVPQCRRQRFTQFVGQCQKIGRGEFARLRCAESRMVAQLAEQFLAGGRLRLSRAQLRQQVVFRVGKDSHGRVPGGITAHPAPFLVEVGLGVGLAGVERQHPVGSRVDRAQHRRNTAESSGAQGQQHLLQRGQRLLRARDLLVSAVLAIDAQLLGQLLGDDVHVTLASDGGDTGLPQQRQRRLFCGAHHRLHRLRQRLLLLKSGLQRATPRLACLSACAPCWQRLDRQG
jgi:hypothetical protein